MAKKSRYMGYVNAMKKGAGCKACFFSFGEAFTDEEENKEKGGLRDGGF